MSLIAASCKLTRAILEGCEQPACHPKEGCVSEKCCRFQIYQDDSLPHAVKTGIQDESKERPVA